MKKAIALIAAAAGMLWWLGRPSPPARPRRAHGSGQDPRLDERLDEGLEESFPASDPPAVHVPERPLAG